ncbi:MAG: hypothetical protein ACD_79C00125G0003 [uncultured bacterium]|nr:MAG: hypothetical protein ACD_79C00125G0003 [uncultured bacterium]
MKVLVVDDSFTTRRIVIKLLGEMNYTDVEEAADGVQAMSRLNGVGLIVTDWNMPNMDGLTFVKNVRANPVYAKVPIIMLTTESAKTEIVEAIKCGVNNYVVKPFTADVLKSKIEFVLQQNK